MVLKINNLSKWAVLAVGDVLTLQGQPGQARPIRVELNCVEPTRVDVLSGNDVMVFLGLVHGFQIVEFTTEEADVQLVFTTEGEVWYFTNDGDQVGVDRSMLTESFTKVMQRRVRNPQLEMIEFKMRQNMDRRFAQQAEEVAALQAALAERVASEEGEDDGEVDERASAGPGAAGGGAETPAGGEQPVGEGPDGDGNAAA